MGRNNDPIIRLMYRGTSTIQEYNWENLQPSRTILSLITQEDIDTIRKIILSPRYSGNNRLKMERIDDIMHLRGFTKFAGGTNRIVYEHPDAPGMVFKVAIDSVGIKDSPAEFYNQNLLKPFCCKVFECSACGTIASFEKVKRITTIEEFYTIIDDYYFMITNNIIGKYVMEDIGIKYFMNFGIRIGQGPVILDFPYLFELDGNKLICNAELDDHSICYGEIDYDYGFNKLICTKCGRHYMARDLALSPEKRKALLRSKGAAKMRVNLINATNGNVIKSVDTNDIREYLSKDTINSTTRKKNKENKTMRVNIVTTKVSVQNTTSVENITPMNNNVAETVVDNTVKNDNVNKVEKTITVKLGGRQITETKKDDKTSSGLNVKLVNKPARNNNSSSNKNKKNNRINTSNVHNSVDTQDNSRKKFNKNNNNVEAPIVKSVINVSLGGKSNSSQIIKADTSDHKLNIYTSPVVKNETKKEEEVKEEPVMVENVPVETVVKEETIMATGESKEEINEPTEEEVSKEEEVMPSEDNFASVISEIPSMENKEEAEIISDTDASNIEENASDDLEKFRVWYMNKLPEDLSKYDGEVIIISNKDRSEDAPETDVIDYTKLDLVYDDNVYIKDGKAYIISDFEEDDNEVKIIISDYIVDDTAQMDESEVSTEEESTDVVEPISSMSDDDVINRIINASSSKPSLSDMYKNK